MLSRLQTAALLALALGVWIGLLALRGLEVSWEYFWPFGSVLTVLTVALVAWDRVLWRIPLLH